MDQLLIEKSLIMDMQNSLDDIPDWDHYDHCIENMKYIISCVKEDGECVNRWINIILRNGQCKNHVWKLDNILQIYKMELNSYFINDVIDLILNNLF